MIPVFLLKKEPEKPAKQKKPTLHAPEKYLLDASSLKIYTCELCLCVCGATVTREEESNAGGSFV